VNTSDERVEPDVSGCSIQRFKTFGLRESAWPYRPVSRSDGDKPAHSRGVGGFRLFNDIGDEQHIGGRSF
jgi:hypothetical protein